jgi:hypothetical protein
MVKHKHKAHTNNFALSKVNILIMLASALVWDEVLCSNDQQKVGQIQHQYSSHPWKVGQINNVTEQNQRVGQIEQLRQ